MKRRILVATPLLAALPFTLPAARAAVPEAQPVTTLDNALISVMKAGSAGQSFQARYTMLKPVVEQSFDLSLILRNSAGLLWSQIPPPQQTELATVFRQYTVATYVSRFDKYGGQHFTTAPTPRSVGASKVVDTDLISGAGKKTRLSYVMTQAGGGWKISDVLFEGTISQVATQRSDFSGLIEPGNATKLIAALKQKVAALSGGTIKS
ncbi:MAG: ABC transporter substrate-binding protein [Acidiphilium sp.]